MPDVEGRYIEGDVLVQVTPELLAQFVDTTLMLQGLLNEALRFLPTGEADLNRRIHAALSIRPNG